MASSSSSDDEAAPLTVTPAPAPVVKSSLAAAVQPGPPPVAAPPLPPEPTKVEAPTIVDPPATVPVPVVVTEAPKPAPAPVAERPKAKKEHAAPRVTVAADEASSSHRVVLKIVVTDDNWTNNSIDSGTPFDAYSAKHQTVSVGKHSIRFTSGTDDSLRPLLCTFTVTASDTVVKIKPDLRRRTADGADCSR